MNDQSDLEVVSKRPVAEHFKEGVMMGVMADIIEIVVFATDTDTFLTVDDTSIAGHGTQWINSTEEQRFELYTQKIHIAFYRYCDISSAYQHS